jgi:hypothetical protein
VLEGARFIKGRWDFSDDDFARLWTFCTLLFLAAAVYAFTANDGPQSFGRFFSEPNLRTERTAGNMSAKTAASVIQWLPMLFFLFMGVYAYSGREGIPLTTLSLIMRRRWKRAQQLGQPIPDLPTVQIGYPFFAVCLFAASIHQGEDISFFWGVCALIGWALWPQRSRRFGLSLWVAALMVTVTAGYYGQGGLGRLRNYVETLNPQWLLNLSRRRFDPTQSKTALGKIGRIKTSSQIVIRGEPKENSPIPNLLREASYRTYKGQTWFAGMLKNDFESVYEDPGIRNTYILIPNKTNQAGVNISCYLEGREALLPLPYGSGRVENLSIISLYKNKLGSVLAAGPGLVVFDAFYGPGSTLDSAPVDEDYSVPEREVSALQQVAQELNVRRENTEQALRAVQAYFAKNFTYRWWQPEKDATGPNESPLGHFLLESKSGHCEYFATATVLLLRQMHIPARYAVGYAVHETSGKKFVVRQRDAHAWCLVWNSATKTWQDFDTTPATWIEEERSHEPGLQWLRDLWGRLKFELSRLRWGQTQLRQYLLMAVVPVLALLLLQIILRRRKTKKSKKENKEDNTLWPGIDSEFYLLEKKLEGKGVVRDASEPLQQFLKRACADAQLAAMKRELETALQLHYRYRFDPQGLSGEERSRLREVAQIKFEPNIRNPRVSGKSREKRKRSTVSGN